MASESISLPSFWQWSDSEQPANPDKLFLLDKGLSNSTQNRIFYDSGAVYEGQLKDGMWHGTGIYIGHDTSYFKGSFVDNKRCGQGIMVSKDGHWYDGEWENDEPSGRGKLLFPNGDSYEGDLKGGVFHGQGIYKWEDGQVFDGFWISDKINGEGSFTFRNSESYSGEWRHDMPHGVGIKVEIGKTFDVVYSDGKMTSYSVRTRSVGDHKARDIGNEKSRSEDIFSAASDLIAGWRDGIKNTFGS